MLSMILKIKNKMKMPINQNLSEKIKIIENLIRKKFSLKKIMKT